MSNQRPPSLDPMAAQRWAALPQSPSPWLHEEVARRMEERLQWIAKPPARWAHWQPLRGGVQAQALITQRYPKSECFVLEVGADSAQAAHKFIAKPWWNPARWRAAPLHFERPAQPVDMLWANMALHMAPDPQALIAEWHRLIGVEGFLMFSCLGPDTLREIRAVYAAQGWPAPSHEFTDMHDWGDMLVHAGFAEPVMDMERITLSYSSPQNLLAELRGLGRNLHAARFAGLRGRGWRDQLHAAIAQSQAASSADGRLKLTFEIIYGHAFKPVPRLNVRPETTLSLDEMRATLQQARKNPPQP
jgi:malonyl-CoA O-methyltransferase